MKQYQADFSLNWKRRGPLLYVICVRYTKFWPHFNSSSKKAYLWHIPLFIKLNSRAWKGIFQFTTEDTMIWRKASKKLWTIMDTLKISRKWLARRWMTWEFDGGLWTTKKTPRKISKEKERFFFFHSVSKIREFLDHLQWVQNWVHKTDRILILLRLKDSEGLALLAIATVTANCQQASSSCCDQHTATYDAVVQCRRRS